MKKSNTARYGMTVLLGILLLASVFASCAGGPTAKEEVRSASRNRAYERLKSDYALKDKEDLNRAGIYYDRRMFYVVISLTDSGTDRYPEWACDKFMNTLYSYRAVIQGEVSDEEFFELVLKFEIEEIIDGKWENLARVRVRERDVERFLNTYLDS